METSFEELIAASSISGVISGVVTAAVLTAIVWLWRRLGTSAYRVAIDLPNTLHSPGIKPGVIHSSNDDGHLVNKVYWLKRHGDVWRADIRAPRNVGFQYKCFIDYDPRWQEEAIIQALSEHPYDAPSRGAGKPNRVWFLRPDQPVTKDERTIKNNQMYPE